MLNLISKLMSVIFKDQAESCCHIETSKHLTSLKSPESALYMASRLKTVFKYSVKYNVHYSGRKPIPGSHEGILYVQSFTAVMVFSVYPKMLT